MQVYAGHEKTTFDAYCAFYMWSYFMQNMGRLLHIGYMWYTLMQNTRRLHLMTCDTSVCRTREDCLRCTLCIMWYKFMQNIEKTNFDAQCVYVIQAYCILCDTSVCRSWEDYVWCTVCILCDACSCRTREDYIWCTVWYYVIQVYAGHGKTKTTFDAFCVFFYVKQLHAEHLKTTFNAH